MVAGISGYGIKFAAEPTQIRLGDGGSVTQNADCVFTTDEATTHYCAIPSTTSTLYSSNASIESARVKLNVGAAIDGVNVPGTYTDVLQFIATASY